MNEILGFLAAAFVGFTLGLIGGGGSILTLPVLVYLFHVEPVLATAYSLFVVGASSFIGALNYLRKGYMSYKTALIFAIPSFIAIFLTRKFLIPSIPEQLFSIGQIDITSELLFILLLVFVMLGVSLFTLNITYKSNRKHLRVFLLVTTAAIMVFVTRQFVIPKIPHELVVLGDLTITKNTGIMIFFSLIMILASVSMIMNRKEPVDEIHHESFFQYMMILFVGGIVGAVTGIVGAGGGFLIIPSLVVLAGLPIRTAIGTSLLIISVNTLFGFLGDIKNPEINWVFLLSFTGISIIGIFAGTYTSKFIEGNKLKKIFGWFVLVFGLYIITKELFL